ncbi:MAG: hypothetical protein V7K18_04905 [Nostoc sp.]
MVQQQIQKAMPSILADITADTDYVPAAKIRKYEYYNLTTQLKIIYLVT